MDMNYIPLYVSIVALVGTLIGGVFQVRYVRANAQKAQAEAAEKLVDTSLKLIAPYQLEVERLTTENAELKIDIAHLEMQLEACNKKVQHG
jgi:Tfp pilus assembly protein PilN